jgi:hypothetical protein
LGVLTQHLCQNDGAVTRGTTADVVAGIDQYDGLALRLQRAGHGGGRVGQPANQLIARFPEVAAQPVGFRACEIGVFVRHNDDARSHLRHVRIGETRKQADGQDPRFSLHGSCLVHETAQRFLRRVVDHDVDDHRRLGNGLYGTDLAAQSPGEQIGGLSSAGALIHVGAGAIGYRGRAMFHEPRRDVTVQIERYDDGEHLPECLSQPRNGLAVGIQMGFRDHGAVQGEKQSIRTLPPDFTNQILRHLLKDAVGNGPGRSCPRHGERQ